MVWNAGRQREEGGMAKVGGPGAGIEPVSHVKKTGFAVQSH